MLLKDARWLWFMDVTAFCNAKDGKNIFQIDLLTTKLQGEHKVFP